MACWPKLDGVCHEPAPFQWSVTVGFIPESVHGRDDRTEDAVSEQVDEARHDDGVAQFDGVEQTLGQFGQFRVAHGHDRRRALVLRQRLHDADQVAAAVLAHQLLLACGQANQDNAVIPTRWQRVELNKTR